MHEVHNKRKITSFRCHFIIRTSSIRDNMSITVLPKGQTLNLSSWTIVGTIGKGIIRHVGVISRNVNAEFGSRVPIYDMGPPLTTAVPSSGPESEDSSDQSDVQYTGNYDTTRLDVAACLEDLSDKERRDMSRWHRKISAFFAGMTRPEFVIPRAGREREIADLLVSCRYIAHPPIKKDFGQNRRLKAIWYSCSGFVKDCYESTVVKKLLIDWEDPDFPKVPKKIIKDVWCLGGMELTPELKNALGLIGDDSWPVVMPGYVINAFKRQPDEVRNQPFQPTSNDVTIN